MTNTHENTLTHTVLASQWICYSPVLNEEMAQLIQMRHASGKGSVTTLLCVSERDRERESRREERGEAKKTRGVGRWMGSYYLMGTEFQFGKMKKVLEMDGGDGCTRI